jgi:hypothetical protein
VRRMNNFSQTEAQGSGMLHGAEAMFRWGHILCLNKAEDCFSW